MKAFIIGAAMVPFGRYPEMSAAKLGANAINDVLAKVKITGDKIDAAFMGRSFGEAIDGQITVPGQVALRHCGAVDIPVYTIDNACAAAVSALQLAVNAVRAGQFERVLVCGMDKLFSRDRRVTMSALFGAMDVEEMRWIGEKLEEGKEIGSIFMENYYAKVAREYLKKTGCTVKEYAEVAVKNREHASLNKYAQYRKLITAEDVLTSPMVAEPLTQLMCSPITDGAAALMVCSEKEAKRFGGMAVEVAGCATRSGIPDLKDGADSVIRRTAKEAYEEAGVDPEDVNVLEVHDASAVAELIALEDVLLKEQGAAVALLRNGETKLGGSIPTNVSGGLLSRGHPGAATGAAQIVELVWQLQEQAEGRQVEGAKIGVAESTGGTIGKEAGVIGVTIVKGGYGR